MSRLDKVLITIGILSLVVLCGCLLYSFINPIHQWGSFSSDEKQYSYDGTYYSIQSVEYDDQESARMVFVRLYKSIDDELICELEPCRYRDYYGMVWENDRYAFWIQSGDIGIFCIELVDGEWIENWKCKMPDYIESKYDDFEQLEFFTTESNQDSFDYAYYSIETIEDGKVNIRIYTSIDDELVYELEPFCSTGYHGTVWEYDRDAVWIKSDDIGTFCIELVDGEWVENRDRQLPEYIR